MKTVWIILKTIIYKSQTLIKLPLFWNLNLFLWNLNTIKAYVSSKKNNLNLWDFTHFLDKINFIRIINAILLKKL